MQHNQRNIHGQRRHQSLHDAHDHGLTARLLQRREAELIADGEGDEAQRHIGQQAQLLHLLHGCKAQKAHAQPAEAVGPDQHARDQIGRDRRQAEALDDAGHQKADDDRKSD